MDRLGRYFLRRLRRRDEARATAAAVDAGLLLRVEHRIAPGLVVASYLPTFDAALLSGDDDADRAMLARLMQARGAVGEPGSKKKGCKHTSSDLGVASPVSPETARRVVRLVRETATSLTVTDIAAVLHIARAVRELLADGILLPGMDTLKFQITSRREFDRLKTCDPSTLTDLERAARFLYLQRLTFAGKVSGQNFGVNREGPARFNLTRLAPVLEKVHERLSGVVIENLDWLELIDRYDRPETLFYLDLPYWGSEGDYGKELFDRGRIADLHGSGRRGEEGGRVDRHFEPSVKSLQGLSKIAAMGGSVAIPVKLQRSQASADAWLKGDSGEAIECCG